MEYDMDNVTKEEINKRFLDALDALLDKKVVKSKTALAQAFKVKSSTFSEITNGRVKAGPEMLATLCVLYGISPEWLLLNIGNMYGNSVKDDHAIKNNIPVPLSPASDRETSNLMLLIGQKDDIIMRQAEEIGRLKERIAHGQIKNVSNACTQSIADAG